jgi:hypothetical protein
VIVQYNKKWNYCKLLVFFGEFGQKKRTKKKRKEFLIIKYSIIFAPTKNQNLHGSQFPIIKGLEPMIE